MKKKFTMPSALVIVMIFLAIVAILTWFVPTSVVVTDDAGNNQIIFNAAFDEDGNVIENAGTNPAGLWDYFLAPVQGLAEGVDVAAAILISGGFLAVLNKTGAMEAGIASLLRRFSGNTLIVLLMMAFALMGTIYGLWEELPAYAIIIIPMFVAAGYDVITGMMVILVGAIAGNMAGVVNPYAIGAAVAAIGNDELSMGSGILLRLILFVVLFVLGCFLVLKYANKVKKDPSKSVVAEIEGVGMTTSLHTEEAKPLTTKQKLSLGVFALVIVVTILGYAPWDSLAMGDKLAFDYINAFKYNLDGTFLGNLIGVGNFSEFGWWYFNEFSVTWLIGAVIIAIINRMPEKEFVSSFVAGAADLVGVVLVLATSRGIGIFMGSRTEGMSITFIHWIQELLTGVPLWAFAIAAIAVYIMIAIFLQSTSGVAGITMPIFGAIAFGLFAATTAGSTGGQIVLMSAFTVGVNFVCGLYPESTNMGICEMTHVPYNVFFKTMIKITGPMLLTAAVIISVAPYIGLV